MSRGKINLTGQRFGGKTESVFVEGGENDERTL